MIRTIATGAWAGDTPVAGPVDSTQCRAIASVSRRTHTESEEQSKWIGRQIESANLKGFQQIDFWLQFDKCGNSLKQKTDRVEYCPNHLPDKLAEKFSSKNLVKLTWRGTQALEPTNLETLRQNFAKSPILSNLDREDFGSEDGSRALRSSLMVLS